MSQQHRHYIAEHLWRLIRALFVILATAIWLYTEYTHLVMILVVCAALVDQFHGFICNRIEKLFGWDTDFNDLD